jgi:hypothetical protein
MIVMREIQLRLAAEASLERLLVAWPKSPFPLSALGSTVAFSQCAQQPMFTELNISPVKRAFVH